MIRLLVVDDSALVRKLLGQIFSAEPDFELEFARNGIEALQLLKVFAPDVVTLDVHMPQMDGLACLDRIMIERPCPVVMLSSLTAEGADATLEAFRLGAVDFVAKPAGALSLRLEEFVPDLLRKVRSASCVKLSTTLRLRERVKLRIGNGGTAAHQVRRASSRPPQLETVPGDSDREGLVVLGASTGGPPALEDILTSLSANFPWPVVIAQHMPASFTGALAKRLNDLCMLSVKEVVGPLLLQPGCAYIARGDADILIAHQGADLIAMPARPEPNYLWHPSVDRLVRTAIKHVNPTKLVGVLITGMGNDGAEAMAELRARGGKTIAESQESAVVWGMPGELVRLGGADWVLPVSNISARLERMVQSHATDPQDL